MALNYNTMTAITESHDDAALILSAMRKPIIQRDNEAYYSAIQCHKGYTR